jgi:hypothetical protein
LLIPECFEERMPVLIAKRLKWVLQDLLHPYLAVVLQLRIFEQLKEKLLEAVASVAKKEKTAQQPVLMQVSIA